MPKISAEQRKKRVLRSKAFADWWEVRREQKPVPSNPYRAYMIDLSLHAIIDRRDRWEKEPNRRDIPDVDLPQEGIPTYAPSRKPRRRRAEKERSEAIPKSGLEREVALSNLAMATSFGKPAPKVRTKKREGPLQSFANVGVGRIGEKLYHIHGGSITVGIKGPRVQVLATAAHETGHVIHAQDLVSKKKMEGITPFKGTRASYSDERTATKLGRQHLKKTLKSKGEYPVASWYLVYALNTYRKGWKQRGKPVKVDKQGNIISGGELQ